MSGTAAPKPRPGGRIGGSGEMYGVSTVTQGLPHSYPPGSPGFAFSRKASDTAPPRIS